MTTRRIVGAGDAGTIVLGFLRLVSALERKDATAPDGELTELPKVIALLIEQPDAFSHACVTSLQALRVMGMLKIVPANGRGQKFVLTRDGKRVLARLDRLIQQVGDV